LGCAFFGRALTQSGTGHVLARFGDDRSVRPKDRQFFQERNFHRLDRHANFAGRASCDRLWYDRVSYLAFRGGLIRRTAMSVAIVLIGMASVLNLDAGTLAGVTLPDTAQVGSTALVLNGLGLRTKYMI